MFIVILISLWILTVTLVVLNTLSYIKRKAFWKDLYLDFKEFHEEEVKVWKETVESLEKTLEKTNKETHLK
jgi:hypothetical protein